MALHAEITSSLEKIFDRKSKFEPLTKLSVLQGEKANFQLIIESDKDCEIKILSDLENASLYEVVGIYSSYPIDKGDCGDILLVNGGNEGMYSDLLKPLGEVLSLTANTPCSVWVNAAFDGQTQKNIVAEFTLTNGKKSVKKQIEIEICGTCLPSQRLIHTNWFHSDCLAVYYDVPVFGDKYWEITESFVKNAAEHGVNCILTPLFTPPLDTEVGKERPTVQLIKVKRGKNYTYKFDFSLLDKWIDMCFRCNIKYFEFSHFFTQWGALHAPKIIADTAKGEKRIFGWDTDFDSQAYTNFLSQLGTALTEYTNNKGITDLCFVHCSDEPSLKDLKTYKKASAAIKKYFSAFKHIDALSDPDFFKLGLIDIPVPEEGSLECFTSLVKRPWTYYCCGQYKDNLPNRFFAMPSIKNRILGVLLYKYDCEGFLHWGFNFYFTQYSRRPLNPFEESDAGQAFPSGDSYIVYPSADGTPLSSLRQKVFFDAIQDMGALTALENKYSRAFVLELIREQLGDIDFRHYPLDNATFLNFREKVNDLLK